MLQWSALPKFRLIAISKKIPKSLQKDRLLVKSPNRIKLWYENTVSPVKLRQLLEVFISHVNAPSFPLVILSGLSLSGLWCGLI